jgi:CspA family cold shock protein
MSERPPDVTRGRVTAFDLKKKYGFVAVDGAQDEAFLHISILKSAGYVTVPVGTTMEVRTEVEGRRLRVIEVLSIDTRTAMPGEPMPVKRKNTET